MLMLCSALRVRGFEPYVICRKMSEPFVRVSQSCERTSQETERYSYRKFPPGRHLLYLVVLGLFSVFLFARLIREIRRGRIDLMHAQDAYFTGLPVSIVSRMFKRPAIIHFHGSLELPSMKEHSILSYVVHSAYYRLTLLIGHVFIVTDEVSLRRVSRELREGRQCVMLPNFVDDCYLRQPTHIPPSDHRTLTVGFVGRLAAVKRVDTLLEALSLLIHEGVNVRALIVGDGEQGEWLQKHAEALGISENVVFQGSQRDVLKFLERMDVFVLPSENEGCPVALLEAMAAGLPIILSDIPPLRAILGKEEALFFTPDDTRNLSLAINSLFWDEEKRYRLALAARKRAEDYRSEVAVGRLVTLYRSSLLSSRCTRMPSTSYSA